MPRDARLLATASVANLINAACEALGCTQQKLAEMMPMAATNLSRARSTDVLSAPARERILALATGQPSQPLQRRAGKPTSDNHRVSLVLTKGETTRFHDLAGGDPPALVQRAITVYMAARKHLETPPELPKDAKRLRVRLTPETLEDFPLIQRLQHLRRAVLEELDR
jgi:hypothetical protein